MSAADSITGLTVEFLILGTRRGRVGMHPDLLESIDFHKAVVAEGSKALIGYDTEKALANVVLLSEIPTTYDKNGDRQVNAGNLLLRGVPGIGKTFFGVILAAISDANEKWETGCYEGNAATLEGLREIGFQWFRGVTPPN